MEKEMEEKEGKKGRARVRSGPSFFDPITIHCNCCMIRHTLISYTIMNQ